jgi:hypothetical protein
MIVLVMLAERFVVRHAFDFLSPDDHAYSRSAKFAAKNSRNYDILCFGESLTKLGVVPRVIRERTGRQAYNLALSGSPPMASYFLLRRVLESGAKPRAVIVDFSPILLRTGPRQALQRWASMVSTAEAWEAVTRTFSA